MPLPEPAACWWVIVMKPLLLMVVQAQLVSLVLTSTVPEPPSGPKVALVVAGAALQEDGPSVMV